MSCEAIVFSGLSGCKALLQRVSGIILTDKGTTFSEANFISALNWRVSIADVLTANRTATPYPLKSYEKTTDDIEIQTSNLGIKDKTNDPPPSGIFYIDASFCDYKTLQAMDGNELDVVLYTQDGKQLGAKKLDGTYKGFRAVIYTKFDLPQSDNAQMSYPVYLMFRDVNEFKNMFAFNPTYSFIDITDYAAAGLELKVGTYAAGDVTATVLIRCTTTGKTGLVLADFEVLEANVEDPGVTALVEVGLGVYTLTIDSDIGGTPTSLAAGEWVKIQASKDDATYITYLSQPVQVDGV